VNPIAMFLSAVMMLEHVGEVEKARRIREAIAAVVKEGKVRTYDMMRLSGGAKAISQGAASTVQMTDAVLAKLSALPKSANASRNSAELAGVGHK
jgi:3-isopropylmalate dehydrogenase